METLAYLHLALAYEELSTVEASTILPKLNLFNLLRQQNNICKAWIYALSLSLTLVLLRLYSSAFALQVREHGYQVSDLASNSIAQTDPRRNLKNNSSISNLVSKSELKQNPKNNLPKYKLNFHNKQTSSLHRQDGKLLLVNDTPHTALIFLYKPGEHQPNRYANIQPCQKRELRATYSNYWEISLNDQQKSPISQIAVKRGNFFEIYISNLTTVEEAQQSCQERLKATNTGYADPIFGKNFFKSAENSLDDLEKAIPKTPYGEVFRLSKNPGSEVNSLKDDFWENIKSALKIKGKSRSEEEYALQEILTLYVEKYNTENPKTLTEILRQLNCILNIFGQSIGDRKFVKELVPLLDRYYNIVIQKYNNFFGSTSEPLPQEPINPQTRTSIQDCLAYTSPTSSYASLICHSKKSKIGILHSNTVSQ